VDLFKFHNPTSPMLMEQGEFLDDILTVMWIEKYRDAGEFTITADADTDVRDDLPIGTYISHMNTDVIMVVENHEISEDSVKGKAPEVKITGRSLETILEQRIVGSNKTLPFSGEILDYALPADYTWNQAIKLIQDHCISGHVVRPEDVIPNMQVVSTVNMNSVREDRAAKPGTVYANLVSLLQVDNLGIKVSRPGPWSPAGASSTDYVFLIHAGVDKSKEVVFSYNSGEITTADYLWSNKALKNAAFVSGKWVQVFVTSGETLQDRRTMLVDGSDIDKGYTAAPIGGFLDACVAAMTQLGKEAIAAQNNIALSKAEVRRDVTKAVYRKDFGIGDLVTVEGDYDEARVMRVSEYVEIEDSNGDSGYPTFTLDIDTSY
jgi:Siphovirus ReqiPepy6 Gp37-like protein